MVLYFALSSAPPAANEQRSKASHARLWVGACRKLVGLRQIYVAGDDGAAPPATKGERVVASADDEATR